MVRRIKEAWIWFLLLAIILIFYTPFILFFKVPIPADTIVGLYHPYRDLYSQDYPNGIPFKNFLITDPVRQTYVWKELAIDMWSKGDVPLWNPYEMSGKPLLANFQSSVFYPLNLILLIKPFYLSWSFFIFLQTILASFFMYFYLKNLKLSSRAAIVGSLVLSFCGFSVGWLEWGNIGHTALWAPLVLLSIDKIYKSKKTLIWLAVLAFSLVSSFLGGHLQTFFYMFLLCFAYFLFHFFRNKKNTKVLRSFVLSIIVFFAVVSPQLYSTLKFILLSSRSIDQDFMKVEGWFIPWKHLFQFLAPDFFGNPATLNYWGTWNYGELVGYIGVLPLILVFFSLFKRNKDVYFFWSAALIAFLFCLPTGISSLPYVFNIPFLSTAQPTRLLFVISISLSILSSFGFDYIQESKKISFKKTLPIVVVGIAFILVWLLVLIKFPLLFNKTEDLVIAKRNLFFPSILYMASTSFILCVIYFKNRKFQNLLYIIGFLIIGFDLLRFSQKFIPFVSSSYLYPDSKIISFLQNQKGQFRIANMDRQVIPPNFYTHYKLQTIEGYDPLYLKNYAEFITALERGRPDITPPFGFNRIITPHNFDSQLFDLLNVRYVLSLNDIKSPKLEKILEEGQTKLYFNKNAMERTFFVRKVVSVNNDINALFNSNLRDTAIVVPRSDITEGDLSVGMVKIEDYKENEIRIKTENNGDGFLVLSDVYYPSWNVFIDGKEGEIIQTDHAFRGLFVPAGKHTIIFKDSLF